ncbi:MAG: transcription-repair coupling factor, partial [Demequina sp.]|nr:transcription-repair coupling factor [Demequina sp.]
MSRPLAPLVASLGAPSIGDGDHLTAPASASPALLASAVNDDSLLVVLTATGNDAEALESALGAYLDPHLVALFPNWETLPHERLSPRSDTVARRLATLRRVAHPDQAARETGLPAPRIVVAPLRAALQPLAPGLADLEPVRL